MELIINDLVPQVINWNHQELKKELGFQLEKYQGLTYTDEQIKTAKEDRATLRKFKDAIENKRKELKKECLKPYEEFEAQVKDILALVDKPILEIDTQVKTFEKKVEDQKVTDIKTLYRENIENDYLGEILPLERIWNDRWVNVTYKLSDILREVFEIKERVKKDLEVIGTLNSEFDLNVKDVYLKTLDLSKALQEKTRLEEHKVKLQEFESKKQEEPKKVIEITNNVIEVNQAAEMAKESIIDAVEVELEELYFRVQVTPTQKQMLREFLKTNKIIVKKA